MADGKVIIVPFEPNHRPNADADVASIVRRVVAIEDRIDAENKLKELVFSEARVSGLDIGALKSVIRVCRYLPQSSAGNLRSDVRGRQALPRPSKHCSQNFGRSINGVPIQ